MAAVYGAACSDLVLDRACLYRDRSHDQLGAVLTIAARRLVRRAFELFIAEAQAVIVTCKP